MCIAVKHEIQAQAVKHKYTFITIFGLAKNHNDDYEIEKERKIRKIFRCSRLMYPVYLPLSKYMNIYLYLKVKTNSKKNA